MLLHSLRRNVKIAARLIAAGLTVSMKFLPGNQDGNRFVTAWYIIVSLPSLVVVLVDEQCRNKVRKRREEVRGLRRRAYTYQLLLTISI